MMKIPRCVDKRMLSGIVNYFNYLKDVCGINAEFPCIKTSTNKDSVLYMKYAPKTNEIWINPNKLYTIPKNEQKIHFAGEIGHIVRNFSTNEEDKFFLDHTRYIDNGEINELLPICLSEFHDLLSRVIYLNLKSKDNKEFQEEILPYKNCFKEESWKKFTDNLLVKINLITRSGKKINVTGNWFEKALKTYTLACLDYVKKGRERYKDLDFLSLEDNLLHIGYIPALNYLEKNNLLNKETEINPKKIKELFFLNRKTLEEMFITAIPCLEKFIIKE